MTTVAEHKPWCDMANVPKSWERDHHCTCERRQGERRWLEPVGPFSREDGTLKPVRTGNDRRDDAS